MADKPSEMTEELLNLREALAAKDARVEELEAWVDDLHSGMYINCVYCGHRYGPDDEVPASMADVLKEHVERCPRHPMSELRKALAAKDAELRRVREAAQEVLDAKLVIVTRCDYCNRSDYHHEECIYRLLNLALSPETPDAE